MNVRVPLRIACAASMLLAAAPVAAKTSASGLTPLHSFHMHLVDSTPQGKASRDITYVAPDKLRVEVVESKMVVVAIAKNVWLRQPSGSWQKAEYARGVDPLADIRATLDIATELAGPDAHYEGIGKLNGSAVKIYDFVSPAKRGVETPKTRVWIGANDGYPHQVEQRSGDFVFTAVYSSWNQPLSVSAP